MKRTEIFKDVKGYEGLYKVSNLGKVISLKRKINNGSSYRLSKDYVMKSYDNGWGYLRVCLRNNNKQKFYLIHRLIAEHFIPNPNNFNVVNHIDGNKKNNKISNLEWCDHSHNNKHAFRTGLINSLKGEKHPRSKLNEKQVIEIKKLLSEGLLTQREIAKKFNIHPNTINGIYKNQIWRHL